VLEQTTSSERFHGFGGSVSVSGPTIAVGAQFAPYEGKSEEGAVYLYAEPAGGWATTAAQTQKLAASSGSVQQAGSVGVSGSTLVESAPYAKASAEPMKVPHTSSGPKPPPKKKLKKLKKNHPKKSRSPNPRKTPN
jgi:FG-GAP repeat